MKPAITVTAHRTWSSSSSKINYAETAYLISGGAITAEWSAHVRDLTSCTSVGVK